MSVFPPKPGIAHGEDTLHVCLVEAATGMSEKNEASTESGQIFQL